MMLGSEVAVEGKARVVVCTVALLVVVCTLALDPDDFADASLSSSFILMTTTASATETAIMAAKASTSIQLTHCDLDSLRLSLILKKHIITLLHSKCSISNVLFIFLIKLLIGNIQIQIIYSIFLGLICPIFEDFFLHISSALKVRMMHNLKQVILFYFENTQNNRCNHSKFQIW